MHQDALECTRMQNELECTRMQNELECTRMQNELECTMNAEWNLECTRMHGNPYLGVNSGTLSSKPGYFTILRSQWAFEIRSLTGPCDTRKRSGLDWQTPLVTPKKDPKGVVYGSGLGSSRLAHSARRSYFSSLTPLLTVVDIPFWNVLNGGGVRETLLTSI